MAKRVASFTLQRMPAGNRSIADPFVIVPIVPAAFPSAPCSPFVLAVSNIEFQPIGSIT